MQITIQDAIHDSIARDCTVRLGLDRAGRDNASIAAEVHVAWASMSDDLGDTDWEADKDGGVRVWGWLGGACAGETWAIVIG